MAIESLRSKLESKNNKRTPTSSPTKKNPAKEKHGDQYEIIDYNASVFKDFKEFHSLNVAGFDPSVFYYDDDDDNADDDVDENGEILLRSIRFLLNIKYQSLSKYKMTKTSKAKLIAARCKYPNIVILNQLYTIFPNNESFIDARIEKLVSLMKLRLVSLNFENYAFKLIILQSELLKLIDDNLSFNIELCNSFKSLMRDYPNANQISKNILEVYKLDANKLIQAGFLTLTNSGSNYNLSLPNLGPTLKMIKIAIAFVCKICKNNRYDQALESDIVKKFSETATEGVAMKNGIFIKTNGLNVIWVLSAMVGCGLLECFSSPVGTLYRLTGKKLQ